MMEYDMYECINKVITRAESLGLINPGREKLNYLIDLECAHKYIPGFSIEDLKDADVETFCHDFAGIINNLVNRNKISINSAELGEEPDFSGFVPRCCKKQQ